MDDDGVAATGGSDTASGAASNAAPDPDELEAFRFSLLVWGWDVQGSDVSEFSATVSERPGDLTTPAGQRLWDRTEADLSSEWLSLEGWWEGTPPLFWALPYRPERSTQEELAEAYWPQRWDDDQRRAASQLVGEGLELTEVVVVVDELWSDPASDLGRSDR